MNSFRNVVSAIICITLAVVLSGCTNTAQSDTASTPDEAIPHIETLFTKLKGMESCTAGGVRDQLRVRAELLRQMASYGEVAIPYLLDTLELQRDCPDEYLFELEDILAQMCAKYPEAFIAVALDESETYAYRWHALFSIRNSRQVAGYEAVVGVLTEENDLQLKIQAVWALCAVAEKLERKELLQSEDGLIGLLKSEEVRQHDKENIIALLAYMKSKKAVPILIELLDDTHVYSESMIEGEWEPSTMSKYAHEALVAITGANLPNDKAAWQEYWGGQMQNHPFIIAFSVIIVLVTLVLTVRRCAFSRGRRSPSPATEQPADIYMDLRKITLETSPASIGITPEPGSTEPWGILMEMGRPGGVATLVAFATGDASLYFSTGGGVIGGVTHENVARAARHFVSTAQGYTDRMETVTTTPLPDPGKVRFYLLTPQGILAAEADEEDLGKRRHELSPLFYAGQEVITELRLISEQHSKPN